MATLAVWMLIAFAVLTFFVRAAIQLRRTGSTGLIGFRREGPPGWIGAILFTGGMAVGVVSISQVRKGSLDTIGSLDVTALHVLGIALVAAGGVTVFLAQLGMGESWRIGVNREERTDLVTGGWFSLIRNPIYTAMIAGWTGLALMVPTWLGLAAPVLVALGLELQVRFVEEPYLTSTHGDDYRAYASRVGRFLPGLGLLRAHPRQPRRAPSLDRSQD
jgi:protein-S-isoprenylcysteine O-methyltransferase Ste14